MTNPTVKELTDEAQRFFASAKSLSDKDGGNLWGMPLYGPMLIQNPKIGMLIANEKDPENILKKEGEIYVGPLPPFMPAASFSARWANQSWAIYMWPLSDDPFERECLMIHELMHRLQSKTWSFRPKPCPHLFSLYSRVWLRLEWNALKSALLGPSSMIKEVLHDALVFRGVRHLHQKYAERTESSLDLYEGLAEYTGFKLASCSEQDKLAHLSKRIEESSNILSFVHYYPCISGPAYGLLLDKLGFSWRGSIDVHSDLGKMAAVLTSIELPEDLEGTAKGRMGRYHGEKVMEEENRLEQERQDLMDRLFRALIEGPVLQIPLEGENFSFDPKAVVPIEGWGTVFLSFRVIGKWGELTVNEGVLLSSEERILTLSEPSEYEEHGKWKGEGWILRIASGWTLIETAAPKRYQLVKHDFIS